MLRELHFSDLRIDAFDCGSTAVMSANLYSIFSFAQSLPPICTVYLFWFGNPKKLKKVGKFLKLFTLSTMSFMIDYKNRYLGTWLGFKYMDYLVDMIDKMFFYDLTLFSVEFSNS